MRVLFDANVLLSYLLAPEAQKTIPLIMRACLQAETITVLVPPELVQETLDKAMNKPYFQGKIPRERVEGFLQVLALATPPLAEIGQELIPYVRDPKDDYLVAYGLLHDVEYLVTGDQDLLVLDQIENLRMITPFAFRRILQQAEML